MKPATAIALHFIKFLDGNEEMIRYKLLSSRTEHDLADFRGACRLDGRSDAADRRPPMRQRQRLIRRKTVIQRPAFGLGPDLHYPLRMYDIPLAPWRGNRG